MHRAFFIFIALIVILPRAAVASSERVCLSSAAAVYSAYGQRSWATWRSVDGRRCWMLGGRHGRRTAQRRHHHDAHLAVAAAPPSPAVMIMPSPPAPPVISPAIDFAQAKEILRRAMQERAP